MNFSTSNIWNNSLILRYPEDKIKKIGNLYFYEDKNILKCQHYFNFEITPLELEYLKQELNNKKTIKFNYINDSNLLKILKSWTQNNNYKLNIIDTWEAPILILNENPINYFKKIEHSQIKKNYKNYEKNKNEYIFYNSSNTDPLKLWNYVLNIDFDSWKKNENSDMKSLEREDLQYLPFLLLNKEKSNLVVVCNFEQEPLAYSLMFQNEDEYWYAVKWGASTKGRKKYIGFYALFNHLEYLYNINQYIYIDFWGRRNETYDKIKNYSIKRNHILITKGDK